MTKSADAARVLVITEDTTVQEAVQSALELDPDFIVLETLLLASEGVIPTVQALFPDIILLDYTYLEDETCDLIDDLATRFPSAAVVAILPEEEMQNSNKVVLAGARAFILYPFSQRSVINTLRRVRELLARVVTPQTMAAVAEEAESRKSTFAVYSPKGGAGCTTVATNLAIALYQQLNQEVLLIDGKHLFGHVALMLNLRTANSLSDLITHAGKLDTNLIKQVVVKHISGLFVLPSPTAISEAQGIRPDDLFKVLLSLQEVYPNTVIDTGSYLNENAVTYMDAAFRVILLVEPNLASLRDARQFLDISRSLSYPKEKVLLVLNQAGRKTDVKQDEIEKVLRTEIFAKIPSDESVALSSLNEGIPIILKKPNHAISRATKKIAKRLADMIPEVEITKETAAARKVSSDMLAKSSRLG